MRNVEDKIPEGWKQTVLSDLIDIIGGGTPRTTIDEYWNGKIPWLSVVDFNDDNRWVSNTEKTITELGLVKSSTKLLSAGDLIISARGTVGALAQLKYPMAFNQSCYGLKEKEGVSNINYLYYLVKYSVQQISRNVHGAVFDTITRQTFDFINVQIPKDLIEQKAIAQVLTAFDDKIENLRAQNQTLETLAQTIFAAWFLPSRQAGGKYQIGDDLPEGWRVGKLGEEFEIVMGQSPRGTSYNEIGNGTLFFQGRAEFTERFPSERLYTTEPKRMAEVNDILVSVRAPVGDVNVADKECCIGRGLAAVKSTYKSYALYKILSLKPQFDLFESEGTVFGSINKNSFSNIEVIIAEHTRIVDFDIIGKGIDNKIFKNHKQIQTLTQTRDTLLPKLMSGELRVEGFKK